MKLNGKMMVAAAMVVGVLGATGCSQVVDAAAQQDDSAEGQQNDAVAQAATSRFGVFFRNVWSGPRFRPAPVRVEVEYAPFAPPAARYENPGRAPSARHIWMNGHWRYNGREYVWDAGHWDIRRDGHLYVQPHWERADGRWHFVPGRWTS